MKIEKPVSSSPSRPSEGRVSHSAAQKTTAAPQTAIDKVDLTATSTQMTASASQSGSGTVNTARVDAIKQAIREGRFTVDTSTIADRLIASVRELVLSRKG